MKVLSVFGTRPEAIKMAPLLGRLAAEAGVDSRVCVTAQHREMLDQVLALFGITPDHDLDVMSRGQSPTHVAAAVLQGLEPILDGERPDWVLVQGDTTTVAAAALAAFYAGVRVGHVEAGLRTYNPWQPFPEETNRRVASVICQRHFAPTGLARENLLREGVSPDDVLVSGNPVIDALHQVSALPAPASELFGRLARLPAETRVVLVTAHRRENLGQRLEEICSALAELARRHGHSLHLVYPVHLNPEVHEPVHAALGAIPNVTLTAPLSYLELVHLMKACHLVLTDSGGIQEEAPALDKPVLVMRDVTERPEAVTAGTVRLVGADRARILTETERLLGDPAAYAEMARAVNPYGDGRAAERIVDSLLGRAVEPFQV